ncbi:MAG: DNA translocase FtsK [Candidatus Berkelbacteria bacterium]
MGRKRKYPKIKQTKAKWYQRQDEWGNFVFDWSLGLSGDAWRSILATLILILAVILALSFFGYSGALGQGLNSLTKKYFGSFSIYIFSVSILYMGWVLLFPPKKKGIKASIFVGIFLINIAVPLLAQLFSGQISRELSAFGHGGGLLGYGLSTFLLAKIGLFPTFLTAVISFVISIMLTFNFNLFKYLGAASEEDDREEEESKPKGNLSVAKASVFESMSKLFRRKESENKVAVMEVSAPRPIAPPVRAERGEWQYPDVETILTGKDGKADPGNIYKSADAIKKTLETFGINVEMVDANVGPTVTQYTLRPDTGVKLTNIVARQNDLALALSAKSLRIEAPIPGKNLVGVEIPNVKGSKVVLKEVLIASKASPEMRSKLAIALGRDVSGEPIMIDLEKMPHLLIAGATGSGKSVCINAVISTFLFHNSPEDLRLILVDPKRVEMTTYREIPHLLTPVVVEVDKTVAALKWVVAEMERRYRMFSDCGRRNIEAYNEKPGPEGKIPYIVVIIDELADLMATSAKEVELSIVRISQMARATGIHLIIATQRPSVDVLTGLIKANMPCRIAFATASQVDSRTILDISGAEKLLGNGDMLFVGGGVSKPKRIQGCYISDPEIESLTDFIRKQDTPQYDESITSFGSSHAGGGLGNNSDEDDLFDDAVETVIQAGKASASLLQRRLRVGYARAARLLDILESEGVIGPSDGAKPRDVLVSDASMVTSHNSTAPVAQVSFAPPKYEPTKHNDYSQSSSADLAAPMEGDNFEVDTYEIKEEDR